MTSRLKQYELEEKYGMRSDASRYKLLVEVISLSSQSSSPTMTWVPGGSNSETFPNFHNFLIAGTDQGKK